MEIGVRKYPIDATTDGAQLGHWWLLDAHPANATQLWEITIQIGSNQLSGCLLYQWWTTLSYLNWPAWEVFVAIEKAGSSIQRVPGVINSGALWTKQQKTTSFHFLPHKYDYEMGELWRGLASLGVLWAAQRKIHCSVAVIWVQVSGWHSLWRTGDKPH